MRFAPSPRRAPVRAALAHALLLLPLLAACSSSSSNTAPSSTASGTKRGPTVGTSVADGERYVKNRLCADCHTEAGTKDLMAGTMTPLATYLPNKLYPPNLTPDKETGIGAWTDEQLRNAIRLGVDDEGERLCPQMQHYADMGDDELTAIISYLRQLPPIKKKIAASVCPPLKY